MKTYFFVTAVLVLTGAIFSPAGTNGQNRSGEYNRGRGGTVTVRDTGRGRNRRLSFLIVVGNAPPLPGCSGSVEGEARFKSGTVAEFMTTPEGTDRRCRITFTFSGGNRLTVREGDGCHFYHGASCEFNGTYFKKRPATKRRATNRARRRPARG